MSLAAEQLIDNIRRLALVAAVFGVGLGMPSPMPRELAAQETPRIAEPAPVRPGTDLYGDPLPHGALARLGTMRRRHAYSRADLVAAFSPDGKTVVTVGDGLKRWDMATGRLLGQFPGKQLGAVMFAPNGRWLADRSGNLLDAASGEVVRRLVPGGMPLVFTSDGTLLATAGADGTVTVSNTATGAVMHQLRGHKQQVAAGAISPDGHTLITLGIKLGIDTKVCHWDLANGALSRSISIPITRWRMLCLSPDGRTLAVSLGTEVSLWDTTTGERRGSLGEEAANARYGLAFSPDSRTLATDWYDREPREARICIWNVATRKLLRRFSIPAHALGFLYFAPDNRTLASSGSEPRLRLWDTTTGKPLHQQEAAHDGTIQALAFTPDGKTILSGSDDGTVRVWEAGTGRSIRALPGHARGVSALAATPDGRGVLSGGHDAQLLLQEWQTGKELRRLVLVPKEKLSPNASYAPTMGLAQDGRTAAAIIGTTDDGWLLHVWDLTNGRVLTRSPDRSGARLPWFSPDARILATHIFIPGPLSPANNPNAKAPAGAREVVGTQFVLQDVTTGRQRLAIRLPERAGYEVAFSPDCRTLVTYGYRVQTDDNGSHWDDHTLHLWELTTGQERLTIRSTKEGHQYGYEKLAISPDGRTLATARRDQTIQVWDVATGAELLSRGGYESAVRCLAFRPDGKVLASGHHDSTILLWDLPEAARQPRSGAAPTPREPEQAWADLAGADARKAHAALWEMVAVPERTVPLLGSRLAGAASPPADTLRKLLAELDSDKFERREAASKQLADFGEGAEAALEEALKADPSADKRRRIERLLAAPRTVWTPEQLRALRAVEVLERIGNADARRVLEALAKGAPKARLTREATASLERIAERSAASP